MTHGSLFSGLGGFDLAAEWAGWTNAFNCEIDPFCRKILKYHTGDRGTDAGKSYPDSDVKSMGSEHIQRSRRPMKTRTYSIL